MTKTRTRTVASKQWVKFVEVNRVLVLGVVFEKESYGIAIGPFLFGVERRWV